MSPSLSHIGVCLHCTTYQKPTKLYTSQQWQTDHNTEAAAEAGAVIEVAASGAEVVAAEVIGGTTAAVTEEEATRAEATATRRSGRGRRTSST